MDKGRVIETYDEFEERILEVYEEISPIPFRDFHNLMREYSEALTDLREDGASAANKANDFNSKLFQLAGPEAGDGRYYLVHPIKNGESVGQFVRVNFEGRFAPYIIFQLYMQKKSESEKERSVGIEPFAWFGDRTGQKLCNQILGERRQKEALTYDLSFNRGVPQPLEKGIRFPRPDYENMPVEPGYFVCQERLIFPEGGILKQAHIMERYRPGLSRPPTLFSVDVNLNHELR